MSSSKGLREFPGHAILGVVDLESGFGERVANLVGGGPILGFLGLLAHLEHHVDNLSVGLLAGFVVCLLYTSPSPRD